MRLPVVVIALCIAHGVYSQNILGDLFGNVFGGGKTDPCSKDVTDNYRKAQNDFYKALYAKVAARSDNHFVFSPFTIWLSLSALAEGADPSIQNELFTSLSLPREKCIRNNYYDIALHIEGPGRDVSLDRRRSLILDEGLMVNPTWAKFVKDSGLLDVAFAPIKANPDATSQRLKQFLATRSNIVLRGNSVLLDSLDYHGLWTTAFADSSIYRAPFFNDMGQQIGTVDMMKIKKRVRLAHVPFMSTKVVELPVGADGRYTMLIAVSTGNNILKNAINMFLGSIFEIFSALQLSVVPVEITIPRFAMSSEFDVKPALEDVGITQFWRDPAATSYVSHPPAMPGGLIQRVSVKLDSNGVEPTPSSGKGIFSGLVDMATNTATGIASAVGHNFIADRPFMFALFDTRTHTCLFAGAFSRPHGR
ncbi:iripin-3-like [Anticarsia gemmatalis]|uniref:iripin-3-like n=1 Tax=Anticarsia gemmatalis TaxID=129554 RepID=UPI003F769902